MWFRLPQTHLEVILFKFFTMKLVGFLLYPTTIVLVACLYQWIVTFYQLKRLGELTLMCNGHLNPSYHCLCFIRANDNKYSSYPSCDDLIDHNVNNQKYLLQSRINMTRHQHLDWNDFDRIVSEEITCETTINPFQVFIVRKHYESSNVWTVDFVIMSKDQAVKNIDFQKPLKEYFLRPNMSEQIGRDLKNGNCEKRVSTLDKDIIQESDTINDYCQSCENECLKSPVFCYTINPNRRCLCRTNDNQSENYPYCDELISETRFKSMRNLTFIFRTIYKVTNKKYHEMFLTNLLKAVNSSKASIFMWDKYCLEEKLFIKVGFLDVPDTSPLFEWDYFNSPIKTIEFKDSYTFITSPDNGITETNNSAKLMLYSITIFFVFAILLRILWKQRANNEEWELVERTQMLQIVEREFNN